jgi:hypothetical protein
VLTTGGQSLSAPVASCRYIRSILPFLHAALRLLMARKIALVEDCAMRYLLYLVGFPVILWAIW